MLLPSVLLPLLLSSISSVSAATARFKSVKPPPTANHVLSSRSPQTDTQVNVPPVNDGSSVFDLGTAHDLIYLVDIDVGGTTFSVQLDTGSSDLCIVSDPPPTPNTEQTGLSLRLTFAIGWASGIVAFAPVDFIGFHIPRQAFIDATDASNPALRLGASGILGLGFRSLSVIDQELGRTGSTAGVSLLQNLFEAHPNEPNFIAIALDRIASPDDDIEGSLAVGEIEPKFSGILGNAPIPTWPRQNPFRWNVLLDALIVNGTIHVGKTASMAAPSNKAVVLLDTGASYSYAPPDVLEAIYGGVPGAVFDTERNLWRVPCDAELHVALQIGGQIFPFHPLDLSITRNGFEPNQCAGTFISQDFGQNYDFDWLLGDNFLRAVYAMYDFGDFDAQGNMGDPYVKLLALVDPDDASIEFHNIRGGTPKTGIKFVGLDGAEIAPSFAISTDISESLDMIGKYMPAMLAVVAFNALLLIIGSIVWLVSLIRRRRRKAVPRLPRARTGATRPNSYVAGSSNSFMDPEPGPHNYEPVSMALTEDTFAAPSPAFRKSGFGFSSPATPGERPKSVA